MEQRRPQINTQLRRWWMHSVCGLYSAQHLPSYISETHLLLHCRHLFIFNQDKWPLFQRCWLSSVVTSSAFLEQSYSHFLHEHQKCIEILSSICTTGSLFFHLSLLVMLASVYNIKKKKVQTLNSSVHFRNTVHSLRSLTAVSGQVMIILTIPRWF